MALMICSECEKEISDRAFTCPHCGNPIQDQARYETGASEETPVYVAPVLVSKKWKKRKLYCVACVVLGGFMAWIGFVQAMEGKEWAPIIGGFGILIFIGGFIGGLITNIGGWYEDRQAR